MKFLMTLLLVSSTTFAAPSKPKKTQPNTKTSEQKEAREVKEPNALDKKPTADCDDKAKKPVEITPESISLGNGSTGCSLDEAHP